MVAWLSNVSIKLSHLYIPSNSGPDYRLSLGVSEAPPFPQGVGKEVGTSTSLECTVVYLYSSSICSKKKKKKNNEPPRFPVFKA